MGDLNVKLNPEMDCLPPQQNPPNEKKKEPQLMNTLKIVYALMSIDTWSRKEKISPTCTQVKDQSWKEARPD